MMVIDVSEVHIDMYFYINFKKLFKKWFEK